MGESRAPPSRPAATRPQAGTAVIGKELPGGGWKRWCRRERQRTCGLCGKAAPADRAGAAFLFPTGRRPCYTHIPETIAQKGVPMPLSQANTSEEAIFSRVQEPEHATLSVAPARALLPHDFNLA